MNKNKKLAAAFTLIFTAAATMAGAYALGNFTTKDSSGYVDLSEVDENKTAKNEDATEEIKTAQAEGDTGSEFGMDNVMDATDEYVEESIKTASADLEEQLQEEVVKEDEKTEESNSADEANYVGYGCMSEETLGDDDVFVACILHKVIFAEGEEAYTTEGDSITFSTPTVSGTAIPLKDGKWRTKQVFDTEEDADEWIQQQLGVTAAA